MQQLQPGGWVGGSGAAFITTACCPGPRRSFATSEPAVHLPTHLPTSLMRRAVESLPPEHTNTPTYSLPTKQTHPSTTNPNTGAGRGRGVGVPAAYTAPTHPPTHLSTQTQELDEAGEWESLLSSAGLINSPADYAGQGEAGSGQSNTVPPAAGSGASGGRD